MRRVVAVLLALPLLALAAPVLAAPAPTAIGPTKTAWYDASYPTTTPAPPPLPPGVTATDLLVSGATVPLPSPVGTVRGTQALAALSFTIPAGSTAASLSLVLTGGLSTATGGAKLPTGVSLEACPTTGPWTAGGHQAFDRAPAYDCTGRTSLATLSPAGTVLEFSDIARVARGKLLSFVIRPATTPLDRLVFRAPTAHALTLLSFDTAPTFSSGGGFAPPPAPVVAPTSPVVPAPDGPPVIGGPVVPPVPPASLPPLPSVAAPATTTTPVALAAAPVDDGWVRASALAGLALLVVAVSWLMATDRRQDEAEWGFGRYRAARTGRAPSL